MADSSDLVGELIFGESQPLSLAALRARRERAAQVFGQEAPGLQDYVRRYTDGRVVIARSADCTPHGDPVPPGKDPTDHATCSAFASAHYGDPFSRRSGLGSSFHTLTTPSEAFEGSDAEKVLETVLADFAAQYRNMDDNSDDDQQDARDNKDVAPLPNSYNSPIHLSGFVAALRHLRRSNSTADLSLGTALASEIAGWLRSGDGTIYEVRPVPRGSDLEVTPPNPYLSYWCVRAVSDWLELMRSHSFQQYAVTIRAENAACRSSLYLALEASKNRLARIIATEWSSLHDSVGLTCSLSTLGLLARRLHHEDEETGILIGRGVELLLTRYLLEDGSFAPKVTALTTRSGYSLVLSTSELAAMLLHGLGPYLPDRQLEALDPVVDRIIRRRSGIRGWGHGAGSSALRRPAFVACTALSFLRSYHNLLNHKIATTCAQKLRVRSYVPDVGAKAFEIPDSVRDDIDARVTKALGSPQFRHLATTTLQLTGLASRVKLDIARRIAQDLEWPILVLTREHMLAASDTNEAVGDLLRELTNVVVFIDDDLSAKLVAEYRGDSPRPAFGQTDTPDALARGRRYLLIVATEDSFRLDTQILGIARIERVFDVRPPSVDDRRRLIEAAYQMVGASELLKDAFEQVGVIHVSEGLIAEELTELVRNCGVIDQLGSGLTTATVQHELDIFRARRNRSEEGG